MFKRFQNHWFARALSWFLILSVYMSTHMAIAPGRAYAQEEGDDAVYEETAPAETTAGSVLTRVAVIGLDNQTGKEILGDDFGISAIITEAVKLGIEEKEKVEFTGKDSVLEYIAEGDEITQDSALSIGEALEAEQVVFGSISDVRIASTEQASLLVDINIYDVQKGALISSARAAGSVYRRGFSGSETELLQYALRDGIKKSLDEAVSNQYKYGVVTLVSGDKISTNLASRDGIAKGAQIAIIRGANQIAVIEIDQVSVAFSQGHVTDVNERTSIKSGDKARLIFTPTPIKEAVTDTASAKKKRSNPLLMVIAGAALVAALSGKGKGAEAPQTSSSAQSVASRDGRVGVYAPAPGFHRDYIPSQPTPVSNLSTSALAACNTATNCSQDICIVPNTAYEFTLATSPKTPTFPYNYTIGFDLTSAGISSNDVANLAIATCNTQTAQWELIDASYGRIPWLGNVTGVTGSVSHFTPYAVVVDNRPDPLPAPGGFSVSGSDNKVMLSWEKIQDANNTGYIIYNCSSSTCTGIKQTIASPDTLNMEYTATNGQTYCFAVSGKSSASNQSSTMSAIKCATPGETQSISLLTPENAVSISAKPSFIFIGSGDCDLYTITVKDKNGTIVFSETTTGDTGKGRLTFQIDYGGTALVQNDQYTWEVKGYRTNGETITSSRYTFTYKGAGDSTGCTTSLDPPTLIAPTNGAKVTAATPLMLWTKVTGAAAYLVTVFDQQGVTVLSTSVQNTSTTYGGTTLVDNNTYYWNVRAMNECGIISNRSTDFTFMKSPVNQVTQIPAPTWVNQSEDQKDPISGGDQYVILNWRKIPNQDLLGGYVIYRATDPTEDYEIIDYILLEQLDAPPSNVNCPTFSIDNPGYCDVSVTNGERYYYKVAAMDTGQTPGPQSVAQSILLPLQRPTLIAPGSVIGETVTTDSPMFTWLPVNGIDVTYMITLKEQTSQLTVWQEPSIQETYKTYPGTPALKESTIYIWNVRAINKLVQSELSQTYKFTKGAATQKPDAPAWCKGLTVNCQGNPGGPPYEYNSQLPFDTITVYWKRVTTANNIAGYRVYRSTNSASVLNESSFLAFVKDSDCGRAGQSCFTQSQVPRGQIYYYAVKAIDTGGQESDFSETLEIRYDLRAPTVLYPNTDQIVYDPSPVFQWMNASGAQSYKISVCGDDSCSTANLKWNAVFTNPGDDIISATFGDYAAPVGPLTNPLDPNQSIGTGYWWRVCAYNAITTSDVACTSNYRFFKNLKAPEQLSPKGDVIANDNITFTWLTSPGASSYQMRLCEGSSCCTGTSCTSPVIFTRSDIPNSQTTLTISSNDVELESCDQPGNASACLATGQGVYSWQIRAIDANGANSGKWELHQSYSLIKIGLPAPSLITPSNLAVMMPDSQSANAPTCTDLYGNTTYLYNVYFNWESIAGSENTYNFKIVDITGTPATATSSELIYNQTEVSGTSFSLSECGTGGMPLAAGRKYKWNVAAGSNTPYTESNSRYFYTGLPYPRLLTPDDGKQVILSNDCDAEASKLCVHFSWDGGIFGGVTLPGIIGAGAYDIELLNQDRLPYHCERKATKGTTRCDASNQSGECFDNLFSTSCDMSTADVFNNDIFTWRVRARDASGDRGADGIDGIPGPWSQSRNFTVLIPGPILASPPNSTDSCYADGSHGVTEVDSNCISISCQNPRFYWSPIPLSAEACYRIEVSDTADFRNLLLVKDSVNNAADFVCQAGVGCNSYKTPIAGVIPMTNGVRYYWRVGASVPPEATAPCGSTWIYSDTWKFLKRPNAGFNLTYAGVTHQSVTLSWTQPDNCQGDAATALSTPSVPPDGGLYLVYLEQGSEMPTPSNPPTHIYSQVSATRLSLDIAEGLSPETDYVFCIRALDDSLYADDGGHISTYECVKVHTTAAPTVP